jgi:hypothetical protein
LEQWVEERIRAAVARGELQGLPGEGKPLDLGEDLLVPVEVRMANRVLRNAGAVPPELVALREARELADAAAREKDESRRHHALARLEGMLVKLEAAGMPQISAGVLARYRQQLLLRLGEICEPGREADPDAP